jgi:hypothetical protein
MATSSAPPSKRSGSDSAPSTRRLSALRGVQPSDSVLFNILSAKQSKEQIEARCGEPVDWDAWDAVRRRPRRWCCLSMLCRPFRVECASRRRDSSLHGGALIH